jgi:hypothetical protein
MNHPEDNGFGRWLDYTDSEDEVRAKVREAHEHALDELHDALLLWTEDVKDPLPHHLIPSVMEKARTLLMERADKLVPPMMRAMLQSAADAGLIKIQ